MLRSGSFSVSCISSYGAHALSFIDVNVTIEGEEGDVRPEQLDLLRSGGLRDYKTAVLLSLEAFCLLTKVFSSFLFFSCNASTSIRVVSERGAPYVKMTQFIVVIYILICLSSLARTCSHK